MKAEERKKAKESGKDGRVSEYKSFTINGKTTLVSEMVGQEYPISFHDLVPYKGPGKLKQTPENSVNKSKEW